MTRRKENVKTATLAVMALLLLALLPDKTRKRCLKRKRNDWESHYYKMSLRGFEGLSCLLAPALMIDEQQSINRTGVDPITEVNRIQMCLRWLAGGSHHDTRTNSGVSKPDFYASNHRVIDAIIQHPALQLKFPSTEPEQRHAAWKFSQLSHGTTIRGCVGVVAGWLCQIRTPRSCEVTNVRSFFSAHYQCYGLNVQACCDHLSRFTAIACSSPGGTGDAMAYIKWGLSRIVEMLPRGLYIIDDNAYVNACKLLTPFPRPRISSPFHDSYNFHVSQLRIRIEMAFGLLVRKWRIFRSPLEVAFKNAPRLVLAACMLHNWCIEDRLMDDPDYRVEDDDDFIETPTETAPRFSTTSDATTGPQDSSSFRQLYRSSTVELETGCDSEWVRHALIQHIERKSIVRPTYNIATSESKDFYFITNPLTPNPLRKRHSQTFKAVRN